MTPAETHALELEALAKERAADAAHLKEVAAMAPPDDAGDTLALLGRQVQALHAGARALREVAKRELADAEVERMAEVAFRAHWPTSEWAETSIGNRDRFRASVRAVLAEAGEGASE
jgi:hypothetical protein